MAHNIAERTIALAGVFQAVRLVQQVARQNTADQDAFEATINSLFQVNPPTTEAVFGGVSGVRMGLQLLSEHLGNIRQSKDMELTRYVVAVLHLERKLFKSASLLAQVGQGVENAQQQAAHYSTTHANVIANLADVYKNTVSVLTPRIIVQGEHGYLSNPDNANKVRTLLLAAIRAAMLWRQCGGSRWQLLLGRAGMTREAQRLLRT